jgi:YD repeat-containing protein
VVARRPPDLSHASSGATVDTTTYFYNSLDMPTDVKTVEGTSGGTLAEFGGSADPIQYDGLGNTLSSPSTVDGASASSVYGYDGQSQLQSETTARGSALRP